MSTMRTAVAVVLCLFAAERVSAQGYTFTTLAGPRGYKGSRDGVGVEGQLGGGQNAVTVDAAGTVYVTDQANNTVRKISPTGEVSTVVGLAGSTDACGFRSGAAAHLGVGEAIAADSNGNLYVGACGVTRVSPTGSASQLTSANAGAFGLATDGSGNLLLNTGQAIVKIAPSGIQTPLWSGATGRGAAVDGSGSFYFVVDTALHRVTSSGVESTVATWPSSWSGGPFSEAGPTALAVAGNGTAFLTDSAWHRVIMIQSGIASVLAGPGTTDGCTSCSNSYGDRDGAGAQARFYYPSGIATDLAGNVYVVDGTYAKVRKITPGGTVSTLAGVPNFGGGPGVNSYVDAVGGEARFNSISGAGSATDGAGNLYVVDGWSGSAIRRIGADGAVTTIADSPYGGSGLLSQRFDGVVGVAVGGDGTIYFAGESGGGYLRKIANDAVVTVASPCSQPEDVTINSSGDLYVTCYWDGAIMKVTPAGAVSTFATGFANPMRLTVDSSDNLYVTSGNSSTIKKISPTGQVTSLVDVSAACGSCDGPTDLAYDAVTGNLFAVGGSTVLQITPGGAVAVVGGVRGELGPGDDGNGTNAHFYYASAISVDSAGRLLIIDSANKRIVIGKPTLPGAATIDNASGTFNLPRQLGFSGTATSYEWSMIRRPASSSASLSATNIANPTFTPDVPDLFTFRLVAKTAAQTSVTDVSLSASCPGNSVSPNSVPRAFAGTAFSQQFAATGMTGLYAWSATGSLPPGLTFDASTSTLSGTPTTPGSYAVTINAVDLYGCTASRTYTLIVNRAPVLNTIGDRTVAEGSVLSFTVSATDPDGDAVTYQSTTLPTGASFDGTTGAFSWTPSYAQSGSYPITFSAIDAYGATATQAITINVTDTACAIPAQNITAPSSLCGGTTAVASVPDAGNLATYAWSITGGSIVGSSTRAYVFFRANSSGTVQLNVTVARDGCTSGSGSKSITINSLPSPTVSLASQTSWCPNSSGYSATAASVAGVTYEWSIVNGTITGGQGTNTIQFSTGSSSPTTVYLTVTNASGCARMSFYTLSSSAGVALSKLAFDAASDSGSGTVATTCGWTAMSSAPWLTVNGGAGTGDGAFTYAVSTNPSSTSRTATLNVSGVEISVTQRGTGANDGAGMKVTRLAGRDLSFGYRDGNGTTARFYIPSGIVGDGSGNLYIADTRNSVIRKMDTAGNVTTLAGKPGSAGYLDGTGTAARFNSPNYIAIDSNGNLYVTESGNSWGFSSHTIRKVTPAGVVTTLAGRAGVSGAADGHGTAATFNAPAGITMSPDGNLYVADSGNCLIRRVTLNGDVTTFAGVLQAWSYANGSATTAQFAQPNGITADAAGNLYVVEPSSYAVRKIDTGGNVTTLAGDFTATGYVDANGTAARFGRLMWDLRYSGGYLYVGDSGNARIRKVSLTGDVTTLAGGNSSGAVDGTGSGVGFLGNFIAVGADVSGSIYTSDGSRIRRTTSGGVVTTVAGLPLLDPAMQRDGSGANASVFAGALAVDGSGDVYIGESTCVRKVTRAGQVSTYAGTCGSSVLADGPLASATFRSIGDIAFSPSGELYLSDYYTIRKISGGTVTTVAGEPGLAATVDGTGRQSAFRTTGGLAFDGSGNLYIADGYTVRKMTTGAVVSTIAGRADQTSTRGFADGTGSAARFSNALRLAMGSDGALRVIDESSGIGGANSCIRRVTTGGVVTTVVGAPGLYGASDGPATSARVWESAIASDGTGGFYLVGNHFGTLRKLQADNSILTLAGAPEFVGVVDGSGSDAHLTGSSVAVGPGGKVYIGQGAVSYAVPNTTPTVAAPSNVSASAISSTGVRVSWSGVATADTYQVFRSSGGAVYAMAGAWTLPSNLIGSTGTLTWDDNAAAADTAYLYRVRAVAGEAASPDSNADLATTVMFSDDPVVARSTMVKASHVTEMRTGANAVRTLAGLGPLGWTRAISTGVFINAVDFSEIRSAVDAARSALSLPAASYPNGIATGGIISGDDVNSTRAAVK